MRPTHFAALTLHHARGLLILCFATALVGCETVSPVQGAPYARHLQPASAAAVPADQVTGLLGSARAVKPRDLAQVDAIIPALARDRVVFVGETHDRYADHLVQLEVIRRLHRLHPDLVIAMEYFQQPFQRYLDEYVAGQMDEKSMLRRTQYFERWRFDYRLYRPILRFAREQHIPLVALNVPTEVTDKVARAGLTALDAAERRYLPADIDRSDATYRERLRDIYSRHPHTGGGSFERFLDVQLSWDEGMAQCAAAYLRAHPERFMVVLAGSGHLAYGAGIPRRLTRRTAAPTAIVLSGLDAGMGSDVADFLVLHDDVDLPPAGRLGVSMQARDGGVIIDRLEPGGPAQTAGLHVDDRFVALDGAPVQTTADVKIALLDKHPGEHVTVAVRRKGWLLGDRELAYQVTLGR
jgi:uncharacterized iron-regulated protein